MKILHLVLPLFFTYVVAPDALFLAFRGAAKRSSGLSDTGLFLLTRGGGPALLSVLCYCLFRLAPNQSPWLYVVASVTVFGGLVVGFRRQLPHLISTYGGLGRRAMSIVRKPGLSPPLLAALVITLATFLLGVAYPIVDHDSLSAGIEARIMTRDLNLDTYLNIRPDPQTGYFLPVFRTPFLQLLYTWFALAGGPANMDLLARTVSPAYGLFTLAVLGWLVQKRHSLRIASWAVFVLASTPIFFYMSYSNGIDTPRIYLTLVALVWFSELMAKRDQGGYQLALVAGFFAGLALYSHPLSVVAMGAAGLAFLFAGRWPLSQRTVAAALVAATAFLAGAQFHYLGNPHVLSRFRSTFTGSFLSELRPLELASLPGPEPEDGEAQTETAAPPTDAISTQITAQARNVEPSESDSSSQPREQAVKTTQPEPLASEVFSNLLRLRGQATSSFGPLLFGRLQMFTGIEHFGLVFYLFGVSAAIWLSQSSKQTLEKVLIVAAVATCLVVLSGVRKLSWSNPRYIGTVLAIVAFFSASLIASVEDFLRKLTSRRVLKGLLTWSLIAFLSLPVVAASSIRGTKLEITNPGSFYHDFRSLKWLRFARDDPSQAVARLWRDYLGIRKSLKYWRADDRTKVENAHDYFAGVLYINDNTALDAKVLLFRTSRFFYYGQRYGVAWYSPELNRQALNRSKSSRAVRDLLCSDGFTHVLVDDYSTLHRAYIESNVNSVLASRGLSALLFEEGTTRVYELLCRAVEENVQPP